MPAPLIHELKKLQKNVTPIAFSEIKPLINKSVGGDYMRLFSEIEPTPLGAASIGQVHGARLKDGTAVALKVRRPQIERQVRHDIETLTELARIAEKNSRYARELQVSALVRDFSRSLMTELDFKHEAQVMTTMRENNHHPQLYIPAVAVQHATSDLLIQERIEGEELSSETLSSLSTAEKEQLSTTICEALTMQLFEHGLFHADPHPGNFKLLANNVLGMLDFGNVGQLNERLNRLLMDLIIAASNRDAVSFSFAMMSLDASKTINRHAFEKDIERMMARYLQVDMSQLNYGLLIQDVLQIARSYTIEIPFEFLQIGQAVLKLQDTLTMLTPDLNMSLIIRKTIPIVVKQQFNPTKMTKRMKSNGHLLWQAARKLPVVINEVINQFQEGKPSVKMEMNMDDHLLQRVEKIAYMLIFGIALLAFSILTAGLFIGFTSAAGSIAFNNSIFQTMAITAMAIVVLFMTMLVWLIQRIRKK
ncbi:ABC1 kinase family protein [Brochothrix campestris]|uniref:Putative unusual protein kinase n=1 Tax=Brochothrix campestris FSL F6-1037 TaxID=1265861 RepID=W7CL60_9LIST|nr:AarF/ABC1/UbiB kinase family protein [Brochothrix campestris]EUJ37737.1 putative unusual protein kinase [Brochothrix campestris FSL F6-1037]